MSLRLAIDGGERAVKTPLPPMFPGGMRIGAEEEQAVLNVLRSRRLFRYYGPAPGPSQTDLFEQEFAAHMGTAYALAVSSGTAALMCAMAALGVGPGDEVIVPAYTWIATASAVVALGAVPVIAEIDESLTIDPADVECKITPHTRAITAVHMRGSPCRMDALTEIAHRHNVSLIEDVAQAAGASFRGKRLGAWGDAGAFSLQFNKIITSGEGGVVLTNSHALYKRAIMYHDVVGGYRHHIPPDEILPGVNFRMNELQAAIALAQLGKLEGILADMRRNHAAIVERIADCARSAGILLRRLNDPTGDAGLALVLLLPSAECTRWAVDALRAEGVGAMALYRPDVEDYHVYRYWAPIMNQKTWTEQGGPWRWAARTIEYAPDMCPRSLDLLSRALHLNVSPDLSEAQIEEVATALNKVLEAL
ncbi:DegT/DnrJ/EryC1/StrS family aminotransferase [Roseiflexus castenholzii]|jgi:dTDP-4-amino-4,6-dideoxygalactose transaminase|uniref:Glutamine--scyllo-inositol transaminase n=1 Tax=Roseiflexus castenholzii (strain DSM 13941 / HLO8) TaxID=383372 RepID=A7NQK6_ROSCS|nr:DegT/DnrJ/EryC1/StrS family aminotransferase [Roseiflexus castenholzii]ABU59852.1 Glutamine--scyllo-inositol transaminase [Roseiflexus castenholzii DSM 13941]